MKDACVESCLQQTSDKHNRRRLIRKLSEDNTTTTVRVGMPTWSLGSTDPFSRCMQKQCSATEPTQYNPEVLMLILHCSWYFVCVEKVLLVLKLVSIRFCLDLLYSFLLFFFFQWPLVNETHPHIRLDFILLSPGILLSNVNKTHNDSFIGRSGASDNFHSSGNSVVNSAHLPSGLVAGVDTSNITDVISDHYPVYASWVDHTVGLVNLF